MMQAVTRLHLPLTVSICLRGFASRKIIWQRHEVKCNVKKSLLKWAAVKK